LPRASATPPGLINNQFPLRILRVCTRATAAAAAAAAATVAATDTHILLLLLLLLLPVVRYRVNKFNVIR